MSHINVSLHSIIPYLDSNHYSENEPYLVPNSTPMVCGQSAITESDTVEQSKQTIESTERL